MTQRGKEERRYRWTKKEKTGGEGRVEVVGRLKGSWTKNVLPKTIQFLIKVLGIKTKGSKRSCRVTGIGKSFSTQKKTSNGSLKKRDLNFPRQN